MKKRAGLSLLDVLVVLALLMLLFSACLPMLVKSKVNAVKVTSQNNMKMLLVASHNFHSDYNRFPEGCDKNGFSVHAQLLPYIEQMALHIRIAFEKSPTAKENAGARSTIVKSFVDPQDTQDIAKNTGPCNYFFCAGSSPALKDNNGVMQMEKALTLTDITNADGTARTVLLGSSLRGDAGTKAVSVQRQNVYLKSYDARKKLERKLLARIKEDTGLDDWKTSDNIVGDRCDNWMDGRFLKTLFTGTREFNDEKPDVSIDGLGGCSALRSLGKVLNVGFCDASVRSIKKNISLKDWKSLCDYKDGNDVKLPE